VSVKARLFYDDFVYMCLCKSFADESKCATLNNREHNILQSV